MNKVDDRRAITIGIIVASAMLLLVFFKATAFAAPPASLQDAGPDPEVLGEAIDAAATWLIEIHRNADGGFSSFSAGAELAPSDIGGTLDALWALGVVGTDTGPSLAYLEENSEQLAEYVAQDGSTAGKAAMALVAAGQEVSDFAGIDVAVALTGHISPTGQIGVSTAFNQSLAMMGLSIADQPVPAESVAWLLAQQETEGDLAGSWDDGFGTAGNIDSTALALVGLLVSGSDETEEAIVAGLDFLHSAQLESGGWEYASGFGENANSTAMVVLALTFLGEDQLSEDSRWVKNGVSPLEALLAWQGESGAFQADFGEGPFDDFFSTVQSLPVLGFHYMRTTGEPAQAAAVPEMTPTSTAAADEETATPAEPTETPMPTEEPATATPETIAETLPSPQPESSTDDNATSADVAAESNSTLPLILGIGAAVVVVGFLYWVISRRREA